MKNDELQITVSATATDTSVLHGIIEHTPFDAVDVRDSQGCHELLTLMEWPLPVSDQEEFYVGETYIRSIERALDDYPGEILSCEFTFSRNGWDTTYTRTSDRWRIVGVM